VQRHGRGRRTGTGESGRKAAELFDERSAWFCLKWGGVAATEGRWGGFGESPASLVLMKELYRRNLQLYTKWYVRGLLLTSVGWKFSMRMCVGKAEGEEA